MELKPETIEKLQAMRGGRDVLFAVYEWKSPAGSAICGESIIIKGTLTAIPAEWAKAVSVVALMWGDSVYDFLLLRDALKWLDTKAGKMHPAVQLLLLRSVQLRCQRFVGVTTAGGDL
jgi:hypothetical protein